MTKFEQQKTQFFNALDRYEELLAPTSMVERDALIQRFEFTFDSGWKTLKTLLEESYSQAAPTPLQAFQEAIRIGILPDDSLWLAMRDMRNLTSHSYAEAIAIAMAGKAKEFDLGFRKLRALFEGV